MPSLVGICLRRPCTHAFRKKCNTSILARTVCGAAQLYYGYVIRHANVAGLEDEDEYVTIVHSMLGFGRTVK